VPQPVSDLVYHMLAKTPEERPAGVRAVADRADVLRGALALGGPRASAESAGYPGATRADLPAAATGTLISREGPGTGRPPGTGGPHRAGSRRSGRNRQLIAAGSTAALCAVAVVIGLYLSGHAAGRTNSGDVGSNTAQHLSSPAGPPTHRASPHPRPTLSPSLARVLPSASPSPAGNPKPSKSVKPTPSRTASPTASASASASSSPTATSSSSPSVTPSSPSSSATP
jgi:eukaryotic-like serine/threonine-protein kinase